jgi:4-hydroxy-tetrahydrodipicolinate synthase
MFRGSLVSLVTPMRAGGDIDFQSLRKLIDWHIENGSDGIVVTGSVGEAATLEANERLEVIKTAVEQVAHRIPVIAGTGTNATQQTIQLTRRAMEIGVDACLLVTPYYNRPTQEGLYQHYRTIAEAVPIPQILYNIPIRSSCDLLPETVTRLANIPNIVGIKEGMPDRAKIIIENCNPRLDVLSGDDDTVLEIIRCGGKGVISTSANIAPKLVHELCAAALANDQITAEKLNTQLSPLYQALFVETNPIPLKWALHQMNLIPPGLRLPLTPLSEVHHATVRAALQQVGIL